MKNNILLISPFLPYKNSPHAGGQFIFNIIRFLSKTYLITLVARVESTESIHINSIKKYCKNIYHYEFTTPEIATFWRPLIIIKSYFALIRLANRIIKQNAFDVIQIEFIETGLFYYNRSSSKLIINAHDIISIIAKRKLQAGNIILKPILWLKYLMLKIVENSVIKKADLIWVRSEGDRKYLSNVACSKIISVFPLTLKKELILNKLENKFNKSKSMLFVGALNRKLNEDAALYIIKYILPKVFNKYPKAKLILAGNTPSDKLKEIASRKKNIEITGYVDDLSSYYTSASVFISPMFIGGGMIYKNLEALAFGLPVITTDIGNIGTDAQPDREILIANTPNEFSEQIIKLFNDEKLSKKIGKNGQKFVKSKFNESLIMPEMIKDIKNLYD